MTFGGFPRELYEINYPAPGDPELAHHVRDLLAPVPVELDTRWGFDHGTWSVLCHVFPEADVPVIQLSIDETQPPEFHYETAKHLSSLRDEGVLIVEAATSYTISTLTHGADSKSSHMIGPCALKRKRGS
jgi:4,5-DOPA dioxygenase extradiol